VKMKKKTFLTTKKKLGTTRRYEFRQKAGDIEGLEVWS